MRHTAPDARAASLFFPDAVVRAEVGGNAHIPQTPTSAVLSMGIAAVHMILDGTYSWKQFTYAQPSTAQIKHAVRVFTLAHSHYGIPVVIGDDHDEQAEIKVIPPARLGDIMRYSRDIVIRTSAQFAVDVMPGLGDLRKEGPVFPLFHVPDLRERKIGLLHTFCRPTPDGEVPPPARALDCFWKAAARSIRPSNKEAQTSSACIRDGFSALYTNPALDAESKDALRDEIFCAGDTLWDDVEAALVNCQRDLRSTLGVNVPEKAIDNFLANAVYSVDTQQDATIF